MALTREDLLIVLGASWSASFTYVGKDLSDWDAVAVFSAFPGSTPFLTLRVGEGITLGNQGAIDFALTEDQTRALMASLPAVMTFGDFPARGSSKFPPGSIAGKLGTWSLKMAPPSSPSLILMTGIVCLATDASSSVPTIPPSGS